MDMWILCKKARWDHQETNTLVTSRHPSAPFEKIWSGISSFLLQIFLLIFTGLKSHSEILTTIVLYFLDFSHAHLVLSITYKVLQTGKYVGCRVRESYSKDRTIFLKFKTMTVIIKVWWYNNIYFPTDSYA